MSAHIIFHQYDLSPFSEKVRVIFGIKGLEWHAVDQPVIMPKPELTALTGGYRRIPVMQIGADIYCDTQIIIRELDRRFPDPALPDGDGLGQALGFWSDRAMFQAAVAVIFGSIGDQVDERFIRDREALMGRPFDIEQMKQAVPLMTEQLRAHMAMLERRLAGGRPFLMGEAPGLADATAYYNIWFVRAANPAAAPLFDAFTHLPRWEARVRALGHGIRHEMSREEALETARNASPATPVYTDPGEPNGLKPGMAVQVMADDYGRDPVTGVLVASSAEEIAIRRKDERVGEVVVHFPRAGFWVLPA